MKEFFSWNDEELSVWVKSMDNDHKEIIRLMNKLHDLNEKNASKAVLSEAIKALGNFTVKHFTEEEAYMDSIDFPGAAPHKLIHKDLLTKFTQHSDEFEAGSGEVPKIFFEFLRMWLTAHIRGIDRKYAEHAKKVA